MATLQRRPTASAASDDAPSKPDAPIDARPQAGHSWVVAAAIAVYILLVAGYIVLRSRDLAAPAQPSSPTGGALGGPAAAPLALTPASGLPALFPPQRGPRKVCAVHARQAAATIASPASPLVDFTVALWFSTNRDHNNTAACASTGFSDDGAAAAPWYAGCGLVSANLGSVSPTEWTRAQRQWRAEHSRDDFGLTLSPAGAVMFGTGKRAVGDTTLATPAVYNDGEWHRVVAGRDGAGALTLWVDGRKYGCRAEAARAAVGGAVCTYPPKKRLESPPRAATAAAPLGDASYFLQVGRALNGCVATPSVWAGAPSTDAAAETLLPASSAPQPMPSLKLYIAWDGGEVSQPMRDRMVNSIPEPWRFDVVERILDPTKTAGSNRWLTKCNLVLDAIRANMKEERIILISDIDVVFLQPQVDVLLGFMEDLDALFQRDSDLFLLGNIGFMLFRCNPATEALWNNTRANVLVVSDPDKGAAAAAIKGGDQRTINKILAAPEQFLPEAPNLRWGLLPRDFLSMALHRQIGANSYNHDNYIYHANMGGHLSAEKGRGWKNEELDRAVKRYKRLLPSLRPVREEQCPWRCSAFA